MRQASRLSRSFIDSAEFRANLRRAEMKKDLKYRKMLGTLFFAWFSCLTVAGVLEAKAELKPSLAILPFFVGKPDELEKGVVCPICGGLFRSGEVMPGSQNILTRLIYQKMEPLGTFNLIPAEKVEDALSRREMKRFEEKLVPNSIELGKELSANFIIIGFLFRFVERIGSSLGVERPASVGFDIHLFRVRDGKMVWNGSFDETQKPLSENLLKIGAFIKGKASWLTAEELAGLGMDGMLKKLPEAKVLEEAP
jgi:hypothetical protein